MCPQFDPYKMPTSGCFFLLSNLIWEILGQPGISETAAQVAPAAPPAYSPMISLISFGASTGWLPMAKALAASCTAASTFASSLP